MRSKRVQLYLLLIPKTSFGSFNMIKDCSKTFWIPQNHMQTNQRQPPPSILLKWNVKKIH